MVRRHLSWSCQPATEIILVRIPLAVLYMLPNILVNMALASCSLKIRKEISHFFFFVSSFVRKERKRLIRSWMNGCRRRFPCIHLSHSLFDIFKFGSYELQPRNFFTLFINGADGHIFLLISTSRSIISVLLWNTEISLDSSACYKDHI